MENNKNPASNELQSSKSKVLKGQYINLVPLHVLVEKEEINSLYKLMYIKKLAQYLATYAPSTDNMRKYLMKYLNSKNNSPFLIYDNNSRKPIGIICLENINTTARTLEISDILSPKNPTLENETKYLLFKYIFDELKFLQIHWRYYDEKSDAINQFSLSLQEWNELSAIYENTLYPDHKKFKSKL